MPEGEDIEKPALKAASAEAAKEQEAAKIRRAEHAAAELQRKQEEQAERQRQQQEAALENSATPAPATTEASAPAPAATAPRTKPIIDGQDAQGKPIIVGYAPLAPRPEWLAKSGPGQKHVPPLCWSLSVEQWVFFVRMCVSTDTWKKLAEIKGEYNITMYDINDHFVKP